MGGAVFAATGNGDYDPASGDYGDSMLELKPDMSSLVGYYAPANALLLQEEDLDLGSTSPALIPRQATSNTPLMAVQGGKDQLLRLVDRSNLTGSAAVLQTITLDAKVYSAPAIYQAPGGPLYVYVGLPDGMYAYTLTTLGGLSQLTQVWKKSLSLGGEGTSAAVRAGVVYVAASDELDALDATTGAVLASAPIGGVHWESPMIARGVVYVTDESHNLTAFQILPSGGAASRARVLPASHR
jgi:outer membrane protein assembly factor BamB